MSRRRPVITVVVAPSEAEPPGLDGLAGSAELRIVRTSAELDLALAGCDVLAVYDFRTRLVAEAGARAGEVPWIHAASAGVDAVLTPAVLASDTVVTNARGVFDDAIAEWVLATLLMFAKDLRTTLALQASRTWRHRDSERLAGRRVLVVGAGSIGGAIGRLCRAVGMEVRGVARRGRPDDDDFDLVVGADALLEQLPWADDVVVAAPLTTATHHLIDAAALATVTPGCRLVNVGRGGVVDEDALLDALVDGRVGAAALDVFVEEPLPPEHPFWAMPQVLVSPHMSGDVTGWVTDLSAQLTANVRRWTAGEPLLHVVDKHSMSGATP